MRRLDLYLIRVFPSVQLKDKLAKREDICWATEGQRTNIIKRKTAQILVITGIFVVLAIFKCDRWLIFLSKLLKSYR